MCPDLNLPMLSSKPLNPSAAPFLPAAPPPPVVLLPPAFQLWHHPHCYRPFTVGVVGKKAGKRGAAYGGGRYRFVPPRFSFGPKVEEPPSCARDDSETTENFVIIDAADDDEKNARADAEVSGLRGKTTVMLRNIPNLLRRQELIEILDEHCREANRSCTQLWSEYDFVYLPVDYERKANKGYAFVNFTTTEAAIRMWRVFNGLKWEGFQWKKIVYRSKKVCEVCAATTQGKAKLEGSLRCRIFPSEEYQPVVAAGAPRNGMNRAPVTPVGRHLPV